MKKTVHRTEGQAAVAVQRFVRPHSRIAYEILQRSGRDASRCGQLPAVIREISENTLVNRDCLVFLPKDKSKPVLVGLDALKKLRYQRVCHL